VSPARLTAGAPLIVMPRVRISPRLLLAILGVMTLATYAARASVASFADLGNNTFACTRESSTTFARDVDKLIAEAKDDAAKFCAAKGKQPKVLSIAVEKPWVTVGFPKATVVFKPLDAGDPALADATPVPIVRTDRKAKKVEAAPTVLPSANAPAAAPAASPVSDIYSDLMKLDELRKKGLLTEDEFQVEKKKALSRSK
jgi:hypothetical protein